MPQLDRISARLTRTEAEVTESASKAAQTQLQNDNITNMVGQLNLTQVQSESTLVQLSQRLLELEKRPWTEAGDKLQNAISRVDRQQQEMDLQIKKVYASCKQQIDALQDNLGTRVASKMDTSHLKADVSAQVAALENNVQNLKSSFGEMLPELG